MTESLGNEALCSPFRGVDPAFWEAPTSQVHQGTQGGKEGSEGWRTSIRRKQVSRWIKACPSHTIGAEVSVTQFPTRKPERATLPDWAVMRSGQQAGFCHPLPGSRPAPTPRTVPVILFLEVKGTGPGCLCGPSRMPVFGSHHPRQGWVLLAESI